LIARLYEGFFFTNTLLDVVLGDIGVNNMEQGSNTWRRGEPKAEEREQRVWAWVMWHVELENSKQLLDWSDSLLNGIRLKQFPPCVLVR
jgi:hypothetical protein